jgi:hypothetical protein
MYITEEHHEHEKQETKDKEHAHEGTEASHHHHEHSMIDDHSLIGITLVSGFIFMLLIDQIGGGGHIHAPAGIFLYYINYLSTSVHNITRTYWHAEMFISTGTCYKKKFCWLHN